MSITEKYTTLMSEKIPQVYQKGFSDGQSQGGGGADEAYGRFMDEYQANGTANDYRFAFAGPRWTDNLFKPKYDIKPSSVYANNMFENSGIVNLKQCLLDADVILDLSKVTTPTYMFRQSSITDYPYIDFSSATSMTYAFYGCSGVNLTLKLNANAKFMSTFQNASSFVNLIIEGTIGQNGFDVQWSAKLSHDSIVSIINALSSSVSGQTVTLSKTAVDNAFKEEIVIWADTAYTDSEGLHFTGGHKEDDDSYIINETFLDENGNPIYVTTVSTSPTDHIYTFKYVDGTIPPVPSVPYIVLYSLGEWETLVATKPKWTINLV